MRKISHYLFMMLLAGAVALTACGKAATEKDSTKSATAPAGNEPPYYAVALTSGSIFFAHLKGQDDKYLYLTDIFYLQRTPAPPPDPKKKNQPQGPGIVLVPQKEDVYGPKDELVVNRMHVIYYQELVSDSKVIEGIHRTKQAMAERAQAQELQQPSR